MRDALLKDAKALEEKITRVRRGLHKNAEVGFELYKTREIVKRELLALGYEPQELGRCGIIADVGEGERYFLLRADMDALPMREESGLEFSARGENMHACAHDMHAAMLFGAAELLKNRERELHGRVRLMFQSAEEILGGARDMIESGLFDNGLPLGALMLHIISAPGIKNGTFLIPTGGIGAPCANFFKIKILGKSTHGSVPSGGINAASAAAASALAIERIMAGSVAPFSGSVVSIGRISAGKSPNVIAESATIEGSLRAYSEQERRRLIEKITISAEHTASSSGAKAEVSITASCPTLINDDRLAADVLGYARELFGDMALAVPKEMRGGGSEDFAYISHKAPSLMVALSGILKEGLHSPRAVFDESVMWRGSALMCHVAQMSLQK